jgi:1-acyl-sn-glycerol-3-phosphate acyltransferase
MAIFIRDKKKKEKFYRKGSRLWGQLLTHVSLVKVDVSGLEHIPAGTGIIFTPNHQSYLDIFILFKYLHMPFRFVIMRKLFKFPIIGYHIGKSGFVSLDRKDRKKSIDTIHLIIDMLKNGESFVIFPEGKLTRDGTVGEFGRGASIIIQRSRKPVVPIAIDGNFDILPKGAWVLRPSTVNIKIGKPVYFENYYDEINKATSSRLSEELRGMVVELKGGN